MNRWMEGEGERKTRRGGIVFTGDKPIKDVWCDQTPPTTTITGSSNQPRMLFLLFFLLNSPIQPIRLPFSLRRSLLGVIVRTPLGGIAAHARNRFITRQAW